MSDYVISRVYPSDKKQMAQLDALLKQEGIQLDGNLDYTCVMYDEDYNAVATGSCFGNTLRCFAVDGRHQGEGLLNQLMTHLINVQYMRGNTHIFLYTKINSAKYFRDLGFYEVARVQDMLVFMENRRNGFDDYLKKFQPFRSENKSAAIVMNANPFTLGHQYLIETAASKCAVLHLFIVSEDASLVPFEVRKRLVQEAIEGISGLKNVVIHDSGSYMISSATFPSYFLKDASTVIEGQARLDLAVFVKIAKALNITSRFVGEEPKSKVTGIYNRIMASELPSHGIECVIIPRREADGVIISASTVREYLKAGEFDKLKNLVPKTTLDYFTSPEAQSVIARIRAAENVVHY